jgi:beta-glucanase (GH16 family)
MKKPFILFFLMSSIGSLSSCKDDNGAVIGIPSNLRLDVQISEDGSGLVDVNAIAENAIGYEFYSGDNFSQDTIYDQNGKFSHTYKLTGSYLIQVRAYGDSGKYLLKESLVNVQVTNPSNPIDSDKGYTTPLSYPNMNLVWQDEFVGTTLNTSDWTFETGTGSNGWGNNELQYYKKENTTVADGYLTIEARREDFGGKSYTSSRLITKEKQEFQYGRIDIRAVLPKGQGIWPALWMLGGNIETVGWPKSGETDIMEMIGGTGNDNTVYGTLHWDNNGSYACTCDQNNSYSLTGKIFAEEFHVFSIIWDSNSIQWFVDDNLFKTVDISVSGLSEFHQKFFFIFNVAVGGNWPGSPDATTSFPQQMVVDYIRVFQDE